jgi:hypothetical protein
MDFTAVIIWTEYEDIPGYVSSHASMPKKKWISSYPHPSEDQNKTHSQKFCLFLNVK